MKKIFAMVLIITLTGCGEKAYPDCDCTDSPSKFPSLSTSTMMHPGH